MALIAAMDRNRVIGVGNTLPWHLPDDLKRFRAITSGYPVVMGRKTFESIGRPLPKRRNVVITRQPGYVAPDCDVVNDLGDGLRLAGQDAFVIGGGEIYAQALPLADRLYLTYVDTEVAGGDTRFPPVDLAEWREVESERHAADERHAFAFTYVTLERI